MHQPAAQDHTALGKLSTIQYYFILQTDEAPSACWASQHRARLSHESLTSLLLWLLLVAVPEIHVPTGSTHPGPTCHQDFNDLRWYRSGSLTTRTPAEACNESISERWAIIVAHLSANCRKAAVAFPPLLSTD